MKTDIKESSKQELVLKACKEKSLWKRKEKVAVELQDIPNSFPNHRAFWSQWNIPLSCSELLCHTHRSALAEGQFVFTVLTILWAFPFHLHCHDVPFLPPSPQSSNYQMQEEPCCGSAAHNTICYVNTSCTPCQHGTSPRHETGDQEMATQAWYFLFQLLCSSPSFALLWARSIIIKWHEWHEDGDSLFVPVCLPQWGLLSFREARTHKIFVKMSLK